jgi:DNA (cytosine-5)-methyltransferase 1
MSYGFHAHPAFDVIGAADLEVGKPSTGLGSIGCNATYEENIKVRPVTADLGTIDPHELAEMLGFRRREGPLILLACPPCTGFSRAVTRNLTEDDPRNRLVSRVVEFAARLRPRVIVMENVPQLLSDRGLPHHFNALRDGLSRQGYRVNATSFVLTRFGLPQKRHRAFIVAVRGKRLPHSLEDLWRGRSVEPSAVTVRRAIGYLPAVAAGETHPDDPVHTSCELTSSCLDRLHAIPANGGSWRDLADDPWTRSLLIPSMHRAIEAGRPNRYSDVYGRMSWDQPAPTIKRECSHVGNGRYSHPTQDRQCTVRELAILQGFPSGYRFVGFRKNLYRQVGDAVPPMISYQLAWLAHWILTSERPDIEQTLLEETSIRAVDIL